MLQDCRRSFPQDPQAQASNLTPPPPLAQAQAQDPLGSFGPWRNYPENITSWTQHAVNAYSGAGEHAHGHRYHGHHHEHYLSHFGPPRGGHRGHHHEPGSGEERRHWGPGGPPRRGEWGSHRGRQGRGGHRGCPHPEFIHPAMGVVSSDAFTVTIELPGLTKEDVEITIHERILTVSDEFKPYTLSRIPNRTDGGRGGPVH